jgi:hypothetical protein
MQQSGITSLLILMFVNLSGQTGSLQIYCEPDILIYVDDRFAGKTQAAMSGLLIDNLQAGEHSVKTFKNGYISHTDSFLILENQITEITFYLMKEENDFEKSAGLLMHFGAFGLFNVNNVFTKAEYTIGLTPYFDIKFHPNFSAGLEIMTMFGKPHTNDALRLMVNPNLRLLTQFSPWSAISIEVLLASGFAWWPENNKQAFLSPDLNKNRVGWDFKASAGINYHSSESVSLKLNFGYWASSSTSDNLTWITHDSMLISFGPCLYF